MVPQRSRTPYPFSSALKRPYWERPGFLAPPSPCMSYGKHPQYFLLFLLYTTVFSLHLSAATIDVGNTEDSTVTIFSSIRTAFANSAVNPSDKTTKRTSSSETAGPPPIPSAAQQKTFRHGMISLAASSAAARKIGRRARGQGWTTTGARALSFLAPSLRQELSRTSVSKSLSCSESVSAWESSSEHPSRCRPIRPIPLRFAIPKPTNSSPGSRNGNSNGAKALPLAAASYTNIEGGSRTLPVLPSEGSRKNQHRPKLTIDSNSEEPTSEKPTSSMGCGPDGGGMGTSFMWLESVNSTMDEVKNLIVERKGGTEREVVAVAARQQLRGRGTKGRAWTGLPGNVFLTVAIPLNNIPVPLSLIPLRVGTLIAPEIQRRLRRVGQSSSSSEDAKEISSKSAAAASSKPGLPDEQPRVTLKWPNDVLLAGRKVAGVLIEAELPFLLVGIGVNVRHKPDVPQQGPDRGRPAACLAEFGADVSDEAVRELSAALTEKLCYWVSGKDSASAALSDWSAWVDWELPLEIRDERRAVKPVGVEPDGRLRVVDPRTGEEEILTTEYLL